MHPGTRGRYLLDVKLARRDGSPVVLEYRPIALTGSKTAKGAMQDRDVVALILDHRQQVKELGLREEMAERSPTRTGASYVGSDKCAACHASAFKLWKESKHGHAWETLVEAEAGDRYGWPVTHYPDCVACHTVGYGEKSGFVSPEKTPGLRGVGCEECHGPASDHIRNPIGAVLGKVDVGTCRDCHDFEQTPDFDYSERWQKIAHELEDWMREAREARERKK